MIVALKKYNGSPSSVKNAIDLCQGFNGLRETDKILIKPNIFWGGGFITGIPRFGIVTTSRIIEDIIISLKEHGCSKITIGEGSVLDRALGSQTKRGFKWIGASRLAKKYGLKLVDFYDTEFKSVDLGEYKAEISREVFETDFFINVPVMKTHLQAMVSLGMKNLKGCLSMKSKKYFHRKDLHGLIARLADHINPHLTIIDGIYCSETGPGPMNIAHRTDLVMAGRDVFSTDIIAAGIMGIDPRQVPHFQRFAELTGRQIEPDSIETAGDPPESFGQKLQWVVDFNEYIANENIEGLRAQPPKDFMCSGCITGIHCGLSIFIKDNKNYKFNNIEFVIDEGLKDASTGTAVLTGNCLIKRNPDLKNAIKIAGCPINAVDIYYKMLKLVPWHRALSILIRRAIKIVLQILGINIDQFMMKDYSGAEYEEGHFK